MSLVFWDSMLFVYAFEGSPKFGDLVKQNRDAIKRRGDQLCTSILCAAEVMVGPQKHHNPKLMDLYRNVFESPDLRLLPFELGSIHFYAQLRAQYRLSPPDAMNLACAAEAKVDLFLTNDQRLNGKHLPGLPLIASLDGGLF